MSIILGFVTLNLDNSQMDGLDVKSWTLNFHDFLYVALNYKLLVKYNFIRINESSNCNFISRADGWGQRWGSGVLRFLIQRLSCIDCRSNRNTSLSRRSNYGECRAGLYCCSRSDPDAGPWQLDDSPRTGPLGCRFWSLSGSSDTLSLSFLRLKWRKHEWV